MMDLLLFFLTTAMCTDKIMKVMNIIITCFPDLLQPVLFSLYGNQYEAREEHLLLTMFQVAFILS